MKTSAILKEIKTLPIRERFVVVEKTLAMIREAKDVSAQKKKLERAAKVLAKDYCENRELMALTSLDSEEFYESR